MSHLLSCQNISKAFGAQSLFHDLSFSIQAEQRLGIIGPNGSGKSTLLKIIAGLEELDDGKIFKSRSCRISYLHQQENFEQECQVTTILSQAASHLDETERLALVQRLAGQCGFFELEKKVSQLSGGWQKRLAIAAVLLEQPDLLLLDEPTNHLDIDTIIWLEQLLKGLTCSMIIISHDRFFLENCCNGMMEINRCYPGGQLSYPGNYSQFLEKRSQFLEQQAQQQEVLTNKVRREVAWLRRGPKARTSKARYRINQAHDLQNDLKNVQQRNQANKKMQMELGGTGRKSKKLLWTEKLGKSWQEQELFSELSFTLGPGSRLGLVGANGCGKSTLMAILADEQQPDQGEVKMAADLRIVHFDQKRSRLDQQTSLRHALCPDGDHVNYLGRSLHVVSWAKRFLFSPDQLDMPVGHLSGGEQARILLAQLMLQPADLLLLDEPTNDLDIDAIGVLEEALDEFQGAVVLVSHDRAFLSLAQSIVGFLPDKGCQLYADVEQWLQAGRGDKKKSKSRPKQHKKKKAAKAKLSYKEKQELEGMEEKILTVEEDLELCRSKIEEPDIMANAEALADWCAKLDQFQQQADALYSRWQELEEKQ